MLAANSKQATRLITTSSPTRPSPRSIDTELALTSSITKTPQYSKKKEPYIRGPWFRLYQAAKSTLVSTSSGTPKLIGTNIIANKTGAASGLNIATDSASSTKIRASVASTCRQDRFLCIRDGILLGLGF